MLVNRVTGENDQFLVNAIRVDIPRRDSTETPVTLGEIVDEINNHVFASTLFEVSIVNGDRGAGLATAVVDSLPILRLSGGGTVQVARNDDYFSSDSFLSARLTDGVYYIGVAASGNDAYDPALPDSGFGGRTQGDYELLVKFEPQVSQSDIIRDRDSDRVGVPGTAIDGDLDGVPGGVHNFWFQTRSQERILDVTSSGAGIVPGQTMTITAANGTSRRFEFVPFGESARPGNLAVEYNPGPNTASPPNVVAQALRNRINSVLPDLGVVASTAGPTQVML